MTERPQMGLAATKLRPPAPPRRLVRRSRLDGMLDAAMDSRVRVVLVSAPAGSGKSTLLASWLAGRTEAVAWLQTEESDSDPARFWSYLVASIGQAHPISAAVLKPVVVGSKGDDLVVVSALVNELAAVTEALLVVIDDYHLIDNASVHRGMERLIDLCPHQVTIVVSTRFDPPFRLGRLRVRDQITEIRGADLRFDAGEAAGLLGPAGQALDPAHLNQLCDRTEGWAAGLVLAELTLKRVSSPRAFVEAFRGDDRLVVEYLRDELLAVVDPKHRQRLLQTSILEQLTGPVVDAVTGESGGARWLSDTAAINQLLIRLDRTGSWFRYHHLFRDLLRMEAEQTFPQQMPDLHARAAAWFEAQGDHGQAIVHRLACGDVRAAADLLRFLGPRLLMEGQVETLRGLLDRLGDVARTVTWCALLYGWCDYLDGHYSRAERWLDTMVQVAPEGFDHTLATSLRMNISLARGDVASALEAARRVTAADDLRSHPCDLAVATGAAYAWAGMAEEARGVLRYAEDRAATENFSTAHVLALVYQAIVELDSGSATGAQAAASTAVQTAQQLGLAAYPGVAPAFAIRARTGADPARARTDAHHAVELARRSPTDLALLHVLTTCADTMLGLGDSGAGALLAQARAVLARCPDPGIAGRYLARTESRQGGVDANGGPASVADEHLTGRELTVLRYLPARMSQREIAAELFVSLNTIKTHCRGIYRKLGVADRKAAVQAARDAHLL
ncbi:LuxR C-terminal-related transcriptional regulator [Intrasporangium sp.]|uniref:LuxR C-terminal-related transcriptional regulator n=1 Tax=Intrasporangium sp. TaxID=1925024 RepID=UPI0026492F83|nr:LuxR C-terminal-related transcriptional regulator [Intrasporangium sp.]